MMIKFNESVINSSHEMLSRQISQLTALEANKIFEHDLYKIGYKVTGEKIRTADSTEIKYLTDIDNNNALDSIRYYIGTTSNLSNTTNPNDKPLYRELNVNQVIKIGHISNFKLSYFDSTGSQLSYSNLSNAANRSKIKTIQAVIKFESDEPHDSTYQGIDIYRIIRPKNLNL